jgi:hypothetical protein
VIDGVATGLLRPAAALDASARAAATTLSADALDRLGVSHLVVRPGTRVPALPGWHRLARLDVADVYERGRSASLVRSDGPRVRWARPDPGRYTVRVDRADGPFSLTLAETFGRGWRLDAPPGWSARHRVVDGYANGWRVDGHGSATLTIRHSPSQTVVWLAALASGATVDLAAGFTLLLQAKRGRGPAPEGARPRGCGNAHLT